MESTMRLLLLRLKRRKAVARYDSDEACRYKTLEATIVPPNNGEKLCRVLSRPNIYRPDI